MKIQLDFNNIKVKEQKKDFTVKILMLKGEKGDTGDLDQSKIVDNLTSTDNTKVLSAKQGKVLKDLVDDNTTKINKKPYYFNTVADMKAYNLSAGDMAITKGYYSANDGGGAEYEIVSGTYTDDGGFIHSLSNGLYAKLIIKDKYNIKNFGFTIYNYTDNNTLFKLKNITNALQNLINHFYNNKNGNVVKLYSIYIPDDNYYINDTIDLKNLCVSLVGNQVGIKYTAKYTWNIKDKILTNVDGSVFTNGELNLEGLNFDDICNTNVNDHILVDCKTRTFSKCWTLGYDIIINGGTQSVSVIQNNQFLGIRKYFLKAIVIDSIICNNYINGEGTNAVGIYGNISHSAITNNYIDFFKMAIQSDPINNTNIIGNQIDYCYIGINIGGAEGVTISSNNFAHMSKYYYDNSNNHYPAGSDEATNDWICIKLGHTQKAVQINDNTGTSIDLFIDCYNTVPSAYTSIHSSGNTLTKMNTEASHNVSNKFINLLYFYNDRDYNNDIIFEELNNTTYTEAPTHRNTYNGQVCYYNNVKYKNVNGSIIAIGILDYEKFTKFNFTDFDDANSKVNIDLTILPQNIDKSELFLEVNTMVDYSLLQVQIYRIVRNGNNYRVVPIVEETSSYITTNISINSGILTISTSGSATSNTKTLSYRIYGI